MTTNFNYTEFKNGKIATTKMGKAVRFISETKDGMVLVAQEKYKGFGFDNISCPAEALTYTKEGIRKNFPTPFNQLYFA